MQYKFFRTLYQHFINFFFIHFGAQGNRGQRLCFTACKYG